MRRTTETRSSGSGGSSSGRTRCSRSSQAGMRQVEPVHLFWHGLDLAYTRFGGGRAPALRRGSRRPRGVFPRSDLVRVLARGREVRAPTYYSYTAPSPPAFASSHCTQARRSGRHKGTARSRSCPTTRFGRRWTRKCTPDVPGQRVSGGREPVWLGSVRACVFLVSQLIGAEPTPGTHRTAYTRSGGVMDDSQVHGTIEQLVAEEHELWEREAAGNGRRATVSACAAEGLARPMPGFSAPAPRTAETVATRMRPTSGGRKSSRATSSSDDSASAEAERAPAQLGRCAQLCEFGLAPHHRRFEALGHVGVRVLEAAKLRAEHEEQPGRRGRCDRGVSLAVAEERHLAEEIPRAESRDSRAVRADDRIAVGDDEERVAGRLRPSAGRLRLESRRTRSRAVRGRRRSSSRTAGSQRGRRLPRAWLRTYSTCCGSRFRSTRSSPGQHHIDSAEFTSITRDGHEGITHGAQRLGSVEGTASRCEAAGLILTLRSPGGAAAGRTRRPSPLRSEPLCEGSLAPRGSTGGSVADRDESSLCTVFV